MSYLTKTICVVLISLAASVLAMFASVVLGVLVFLISPFFVGVTIFLTAESPIVGALGAMAASSRAERFMDRFS